MTVYVDAVFLLNTLINAMLLHATAWVRGAPRRSRRLWLAAALGGLYAVLCYVPGLEGLRLWPVKLLAMAGMLALSFGLRRSSVADGAVFGLLSVGLCGLVYFVVTALGQTQISSAGLYPVTFPELLLTAGLAFFTLRLVQSKAAVRAGEEVVPLTLKLGEREYHMTALYDTGNSLRDPTSGEPVTIVSADALVQALGVQAARAIRRGDLPTAMRLLAPHHPRLIPYRAVGVAGGMLIVVRCSALHLGRRPQKNTLIALSPTPVSDGGAFTALVGGMTHEQQSMGKNHSLFSTPARRKNHVYQRKRRAAAAAQERRGAANAAADGAGRRGRQADAHRA